MYRHLFAAAALLLAAASPAFAGDVEDCRSTEQVANEVRLKACTAVIDGTQASAVDKAFAYLKRALVSSANPDADPQVILADVSKAIELDPGLTEAYAFRAIAYNRGMQYDKAIADLTAAIALKPDRWSYYSLRAMTYLQKKDSKDALADYRKALSLDPPATSADMIRQRVTKLEQATAQ